jgi:hypothetical protein
MDLDIVFITGLFIYKQRMFPPVVSTVRVSTVRINLIDNKIADHIIKLMTQHVT